MTYSLSKNRIFAVNGVIHSEQVYSIILYFSECSINISFSQSNKIVFCDTTSLIIYKNYFSGSHESNSATSGDSGINTTISTDVDVNSGIEAEMSPATPAWNHGRPGTIDDYAIEQSISPSIAPSHTASPRSSVPRTLLGNFTFYS